MGRFIRGIVIGSILGLVIAPMQGQELRQLLSERVQKLLGYLPDNAQLKHYTQQVVDQASQVASNVKSNVQQATPQFKNTADQLGTAVQQTTSKIQQTGKDTADTVRQRASSALQGVQENISAAKDSTVSGGENKQVDPLDRMNSVPPEVREKLEAKGIQSTPQLLENAQTQAERADLANKVGMSHRELREFTYRADLMRITNLGEHDANVLEEAGVKGCQDLQNRNPEHLYAKLLNMQESGSVASPIPNIEQITRWIAEAKDMTLRLPK
jgi:gas vesicle protein